MRCRATSPTPHWCTGTTCCLKRGVWRADEPEEDEAAEDEEPTEGGGSKVRLKAWSRRRGRNLGLEAPGGRPPPLIDQVHRLMHLWRAGDQVKVDEYLDDRGLLRSALFNRILQALIELADAGSDERSLLEASEQPRSRPGRVGLSSEGVADQLTASRYCQRFRRSAGTFRFRSTGCGLGG